MPSTSRGFILSRHWRDDRAGLKLEYWLTTDSGPVQLLVDNQEAVFFLSESQWPEAEKLLQSLFRWRSEPVALRDFSLRPVRACYFKHQRTLREARDVLTAAGLNPLEADIKPSDRFLMERFARASLRYRGVDDSTAKYLNPAISGAEYWPQLKLISLDIETAMQGLKLFSIAVYGVEDGAVYRRVFILSQHRVEANDDDGELVVQNFSDERSLLRAFFCWLHDYDPDVIVGWNVINFDMWFLQRLCDQLNIPFELGRGGDTPHWRLMDEDGDRRAISLSGRVVLDGIELLKAAAYRYDSFALGFVAAEVLSDKKLLAGSGRGEQIAELFRGDKAALAAYNIQDCKLVWDILQKLKLLDFAIAKSLLTGLPLDRIGGSVASFDFRYLPLLHRRGYVAPNGHLGDYEASPGGFVMESRPGIYQHVLVLDFKSLYPSIIRSFFIDPLALAVASNEEHDQSALAPGFKGAWFAREQAILPDIIKELWAARDTAKRENNEPLSYAIKIIMNSFYGVLGSGGCRFFDSKLASSITRRGHQIIQQTASHIDSQLLSDCQCQVIYGDTDSVFVHLRGVDSDERAQAAGRALADKLNEWWTERLRSEYAIESALEIQFETHFQQFLMPTVRGSDQGSKKRYAGVVVRDGEQQLIFKGLETVRTDWTVLAKDFQLELYRRIFFGEPYREFVKNEVALVLAGKRDQQLFYRKRLRRKLADYQRNIPPHVQAAHRAVAAGADIRRGDWVEYLITLTGAEPRADSQSAIDYQHYIDRQLAPVADSILYFLNDSLAAIVDKQLSMF